MAARTPRHIIEAIRGLILPPDGSEGMRRTAKIIEEMERRRLGSPSKDIVRKVFFALDIEPDTGPEAGAPGVGRPMGARDRRERREFVPRAKGKTEVIHRLRAEHPTWSYDALGAEYGRITKTEPMTRQLVAYHLARALTTSSTDAKSEKE